MNIVSEKVNNTNIAKCDGSTVQEVTLSEFITISMVYDDVTVPAGGRVNLQTKEFDNLPEGFKIVGFFQISKLRGTSAPSGDTSWRKVSIESFSTTGGTTRPNVSFCNAGDTDSIIRATIGCLCKRDKTYKLNVLS